MGVKTRHTQWESFQDTPVQSILIPNSTATQTGVKTTVKNIFTPESAVATHPILDSPLIIVVMGL